MFDNINNILYKPKGSEEFKDETGKFVPYLVQRWCSMHSPSMAFLINQTSNQVWSIFENNESWYQYLHGILPKAKFKRINYIKKKKDESKKTDTISLQKVAAHREISSREVSQYVEIFNLHIPHEKTKE